MAENPNFPPLKVNFPQGPIFDPGTQQLSVEWFMWLQSLRFLIDGLIIDIGAASVFSPSSSASISSISTRLDALNVALALIPNPSAQVATVAKRVDSMAKAQAMQSQFNPGFLQKQIDAINAMGVFV